MMTDLSKKGTCETCRHWQPFPQNSMTGICPVLGAITFEHEPSGTEIAITSDVNERPISEAAAVRTGQYFGCIHHEPR